MIEGSNNHQWTLEPYKNNEEFLKELEEALLEYTPDAIVIDRTIIISAWNNIDNLLWKFL